MTKRIHTHVIGSQDCMKGRYDGRDNDFFGLMINSIQKEFIADKSKHPNTPIHS